MSIEEYQIAWRQTSPAAPLRTELDSLIRGMTRSERRSRIVLSICAVNAVVAFLFTLGVLFSRRSPAWNELLPALGLQVVLTLGLVVMIRRQQTRRRALELAGSTVREAARSSLSNVNSEIRGFRLLLYLACTVVVLLAFSVSQLVSSGKMDLKAALSFTLFSGLILGVNVAFQWLKYRRTLAPRRRRLEQILASLQEEA